MRQSTGSVVAAVVAMALIATLTGCVPPDQPEEDSDIGSPTLEFVGDPILIDVDPDSTLAVSVAGLGRITGPSGAFSDKGQIVVREVSAESPAGTFVTAGGPGIDISFRGTRLLSPLTVIFDDPAIASAIPGDSLPLVLHRADGATWEARALEYTPDGVPYLVTDDFSPNVLSWIDVPDWVKNIPGDIGNWITGQTRQRECVGGGPDWAELASPSYLVHTCIISNTDPGSGAIRAELQVQSNREFYQWISVPQGNDYLWSASQPDLVRQVIGQLTGHDPSREVLLEGDGWFTAGYRQTAASEYREFHAYSDGWTVGLDALAELTGFAPTDKGGWAGIVVLAVACSKFSPQTKPADYLKCAIEEAGKNLAKPDTAFAAAMNIFGDKAYAQAYSSKLQSLASRLQWLGKALKAVGIVVLTHTVLVRVLNWMTELTGSQSSFALSTLPTAPVVAEPAPPSDPEPAPPSDPQPAPPPSAPSPPSASVADGGYVGYAKNSRAPNDPNYYYWHYLSLCVQNFTPGNYRLVFSNDAVRNYFAMNLDLPANGCVGTGQQGGTLSQGGSSGDWFTIEIQGVLVTPRYRCWT